MSKLSPFLAMEILERSLVLEAQGADVVHMELGEPDFGPAPAVAEACAASLARGEARYTDSRGLLALREAIAADCLRRHGREVPPDRILVTNGCSPAMHLVFSLLVDPGDEVVVPSPHYPCYPNFVAHAGGRCVFVPGRAEDGFAIDVDAVRAAIGPRTRAIVVNSPANPTGAVQSQATLDALSQLGPPLVSDEIYEGLRYDGEPSATALGLEDAFVLDGFSKRHAMTGFRLGYVIAPAWAMRGLQIMQQNLFISASEFVQHAGIAALASGSGTLDAMLEAYARRRARLVEGLRGLGFDVPVVPGGAFYVLAGARRFGEDSLALAYEILESARVGTAPGIDFGAAGEGHLRFSYAVADAAIEESLERLARCLPAIEARRTP